VVENVWRNIAQCGQLKSIKMLDLDEPDCNWIHVPPIYQWRSALIGKPLEVIHLVGYPSMIHDDFWAMLSFFSTLKELNLHSSPVSDLNLSEALDRVGAVFKNLTKLTLAVNSDDLDASILKLVEGCPDLKWLTLYDPRDRFEIEDEPLLEFLAEFVRFHLAKDGRTEKRTLQFCISSELEEDRG